MYFRAFEKLRQDRIEIVRTVVRKIRSEKPKFQNIRNELDIRTLIDFGYLPSDRDRADFNVNTYTRRDDNLLPKQFSTDECQVRIQRKGSFLRDA